MVPLKRRRVVSTDEENVKAKESPFPQFVLFILERKMGASRRAFLSQLGRSKGFRIEDTYSATVTHIISENNSGVEVRTWLGERGQLEGQLTQPIHLLDISWFTESMREGHPVAILERHRLQDQRSSTVVAQGFSVASYACQRIHPHRGHNDLLTDSLSILAESAELNGEEGRGVAFRRAAALLRSLDKQVTRMEELSGLPCLGEHSRRIIKDVLENGVSCEAESTKLLTRFKAMKVLTGIFGVGVKTASRWFAEGICTLPQLERSGHTLNQAQQAGLRYYDDLNQPVTRAEADAVAEIVKESVLSVLPGAEITLTGGFRRGKTTGHDVDFLITHPDEGSEEGLINKVVLWLESRGFLLYHKTTANTYLESRDGVGRPSSNMDRFERCFSIFKLPNKNPEGQTSETRDSRMRANEHGHAGARAVRVDLVVSPKSQFAFALLGWTGSKLFERDLRRWAGNVKSMSLNSHALYDNTQRMYLRASSEEEVFAHLGLEFIPPAGRNA